MNKKTVRQVDLTGKRVLMRGDFNVPLADGEVADDTRIQASLPTIRHLLEKQARLTLCSHLGRPDGQVVEELRLDPVARRLGELLGRKVWKLDDCVGGEVEQAVAGLHPGDALLLENTRFHPEEKQNDPEFAARLAVPHELFVNDAFAAAHRAHASTTGVARRLPGVAGLLMERELLTLGRLFEEAEHPFIAVLGGAKISDKLGALERLLERADSVLVGGGMANTLLAAKGLDTAESLMEEEGLDQARRILEEAGSKLVLPEDVVAASGVDPDSQHHIVEVGEVPEGWRIVDIGTQTIELFCEKIKGARTVVWNGPLGVFEIEEFAKGSYAVARALADLEALTVIGGGDSAAAVKRSGVTDRISHVSTGGGAFLAFLEGSELPGVEALEDA
jgi:phosphoglycerate kinase